MLRGQDQATWAAGRAVLVVQYSVAQAAAVQHSATAAAAANDRHSDLLFIAESYSGNEVGTVMFLSLPFH